MKKIELKKFIFPFLLLTLFVTGSSYWKNNIIVNGDSEQNKQEVHLADSSNNLQCVDFAGNTYKVQFYADDIFAKYQKKNNGYKSFVEPMIDNYQDEKVQEKINSRIEKTIKTTWLNGYKIKDMMKYSGSNYPVEIRRTNGVFSFTGVNYWFMKGNAHPGMQCYGVNIDVQTAKVLRLYDLISKKYIREKLKQGQITLSYGVNDLEKEISIKDMVKEYLKYGTGKYDWFLTDTGIDIIVDQIYAFGSYAILEMPYEYQPL